MEELDLYLKSLSELSESDSDLAENHINACKHLMEKFNIRFGDNEKSKM